MNNSKIIAFLMLCITVAVCCAADLKTYKAKYEAALDGIIAENGVQVEKLKTQYANMLKKLEASAKSKGDFDNLMALKKEREQFESTSTPSQSSGASELPMLKSLKANCRKSQQALAKNKSQRILKLYIQYDKALKGLLRQLTMQDKLTRPLTSSTKSSGSLKATRSFRQSRL